MDLQLRAESKLKMKMDKFDKLKEMHKDVETLSDVSSEFWNGDDHS